MTTLDQAVLSLPFRGTWRAEMSPARRVPSHGTHLFATTYAIDFVAVQGRRSATTRDWRTVFSTERPDRFFAFDRPVLAPAGGRVVSVHEGEADHEARRSRLALVSYALTQAQRVAGRAWSAGGQPRRHRTGRGRVRRARAPARRVDGVEMGERVAVGTGVAGAATRATRPSRTSMSRSWTHRTPSPRGACRSLFGTTGCGRAPVERRLPSVWASPRRGTSWSRSDATRDARAGRRRGP